VTPVLTMVIDDSRAMRLILKRIVAQLGFEVVEAANGKEAMDYLAGVLEAGDDSKLPGLALVDWNMPEMNGLELIEVVRDVQDFDAMKIIMCTTETEVTQMTLAMLSGANEYVMKPFTPEILQDKLNLLGLIYIAEQPS